MTEAKEFQALDTTVVQVRSVLNFMYTLGYHLEEGSKTGRLVTNGAAYQGNRHLSFNTAVQMHNLKLEDWGVDVETGATYPSNVKLQQGFAALGVRLAHASKLVEKAKVVVDRNGQVVVQDVMVKPLNKSVLDLVEPQA